MQKICTLLLMLILGFMSLPSHADDMEALLESIHGAKKTVAVFVEVVNTHASANDGKLVVGERISEILQSDKFSLAPFEKSMEELQYYKEDNGLPVAEFVTITAPRAAYHEISPKLGADYAAVVVVTSAQPVFAPGYGFVVQKHVVTLDIRLMDVASGEYVTRAKVEASDSKRVPLSKGVSPTVFLNALNSAIDQIKLDVSGL